MRSRPVSTGQVFCKGPREDGSVSRRGSAAAGRPSSPLARLAQTLALVNPTAHDAAVTLILRESDGLERGRDTRTLKAGNHPAILVFQLFGDLPVSFTGSPAFESDQKLAAIALRQSLNSRGEPLYSTLAVVDMASPPSVESMIFPQIAAGGGYTSQLLLINSTTRKLTGRITLTDSDGSPLVLSCGGSSRSEVPYSIEPSGTLRADLDRADLRTGYAVLTPDAGTPAPAGSVVFHYKQEGSPADLTVETETLARQLVVATGTVIRNAIVRDTGNMEFDAPPGLAGGLTTLTGQTRAGLAQKAMLTLPIPLSQLQPGETTTEARPLLRIGFNRTPLPTILQATST